jgi:hypothetical protein
MISTAILPRKCGGIDYRRVVVVVVSSILNGTWNLEKCVEKRLWKCCSVKSTSELQGSNLRMTLLLFWMEKTLTFLECGFGHFEDVLTTYFIYLFKH